MTNSLLAKVMGGAPAKCWEDTVWYGTDETQLSDSGKAILAEIRRLWGVQ